jgi:hypothetical protein
MKVGHPFYYLEPIPWSLSRNTHQFDAGKTIVVYYNPKNPSESCVEPGVNNVANFGLITFGSILLVLKMIG